MADIVIMPKQGLQMTEGTIISWLKKVGDEVRAGESLAQIHANVTRSVSQVMINALFYMLFHFDMFYLL